MKSHFILTLVSLASTFLNGQASFADAKYAKVLCDKAPIVVDWLNGPGIFEFENSNLPCVEGAFPETNSIWLKWQVEKAGGLGFTILPLNEQDDIDFVLYRLENTWEDYLNKTAIRCMAAGESLGEELIENAKNCTGATGLRDVASDSYEIPGCSHEADNFLAEVPAKAGEVYLLFINNYYYSRGFLLEFTGSAIFSTKQSPCTIADNDEYSSLDNLTPSNLHIGKLFPNPSRTSIGTMITTDVTAEGVAYIIDVQGRSIKSLPISFIPGTQMLSLPIEDLVSGIYFIKFKVGENLKVQRFIKQ